MKTIGAYNLNNALEISSTELRNRVEKLVDELSESQQSLSTKAVQLGAALLAVRNAKAWSDWGFETWGQYINSLRDRVDKGRTSLYGYVSIAEKLLPHVAEKEIEAMGLSKAAELKKMLVATGKTPSPQLIQKAIRSDIKLDEFKAEVANEYHVRGVDEKGRWEDFGGAYLTDSERDEMRRAYKTAKGIDPTIPPDLPEHVQTKEVMLRFWREFLGTYEEAVMRGEG